MMKSINNHTAVFKMADVWAQIEPDLLDDVYNDKSYEIDQDDGLAQRIKSNILSKISSQKAPKKKTLIERYGKYALMAAAFIIIVGVSGLITHVFTLLRTDSTMTTKPGIPTQQTTQINATGTTQDIQSTQRPTLLPEMLVRSDKYPDTDIGSYKMPDQGQVLITSGVQNAIDDSANKDLIFFVYIGVIPLENYENQLSKYIYNGRSIAEWWVLADLSNGTYPYSAYNDDHGGNITREEWIKAQDEARTLDAQKNCDAATSEYHDKVLSAAYMQATASEIERLAQLGYDVFLYRTWSYTGSSKEKQYDAVAAGLLTKEQLLNLPTSNNYGYFIDWVYNGDGVVN